MFSKLFNAQSSDSQNDLQKSEMASDLNPQVIVHYGIPSTASRLAYDPVQQLLAVGTLDGRIKVIGSHNIEGLLTSPKELPFKNLEFLQNQGFLISVSNENDVQVWDLEQRCMASALQWKSNITAFTVIQDTNYMYIGDECGLVSVLKYDVEERKLLQMPYSVPAHSVSEAAGIPLLNHQSVVGILPQPCSCGNRVLFAYDNGFIALWDVSKDQLLFSRGPNDHQMDGPVDISSNARTNEQKDQIMGHEHEDKEIVSLCWASLDGSILAVGYVDGDILLWNLSAVATTNNHKAGKPANNMVKLQLSSASRRFPVIVLHWSAGGQHDDHGGQLFVYGGDEIGSAEVLTILNLEWSPGREELKNVKRVNVTLQGSFADMILLQSFSVLENTEAPSLFLLSSPGQLQYYDSSCLSGLISHQDESCTTPIHYRSAVPTAEPYLTVGRLISVHGNTKCSVALSEMASAIEETNISSDESSKWPLNGGVPCYLPPLGGKDIESLYIAGYQDGLVRIWNATYPTLSPLLNLVPEVKGVTITGSTASVSALDFSSETLSIAVGSNSGLVRLYILSRNDNKPGLHVVTETNSEVYDLDQRDGSLLSAVFMLSVSPVCTLKYTNLGARCAVGFESGQVAMLNVNSSSVLFLVDMLPMPSSPVTSIATAIFVDTCDLEISLEQSDSEPQGQSESAKELIFALRSDLHVAVLDSSNGNVVSCFPEDHNRESIANSIYIIEGTKCVTEVAGVKYIPSLSQEDEAKADPAKLSSQRKGSSEGVDRSKSFMQHSEDLQILLCGTDVLQLYSLKSVIQGRADVIHEVNLLKRSCWTATSKKDENECGLIVLYQTGSIEIRSLPNLEVLRELSLMSILRWNFKTNMDKTTSCSESGQITLVNGCEFAVVSLLARGDDLRILQSLPCLHDKTLAAALEMNHSPDQNKKKQESPSGILGGIVRGLRASKESQRMDTVENQKLIRPSLDKIFSRSAPDLSKTSKAADEVVELNIDDIDIDGPLHISPIAHKSENEKKDNKTERKELFEGATSETKPRQRTLDEIKAKYRKTGDSSSAASAASQAKNKLLERKEKLEKISQNSEELRDGAENFASMAKELAKRMENRKWWQL